MKGLLEVRGTRHPKPQKHFEEIYMPLRHTSTTRRRLKSRSSGAMDLTKSKLLRLTEKPTIMSLTFFLQASPLVMLAGTIGISGYGTFFVSKTGSQHQHLSWKVPAFCSAWFWGFSIYTVAEEGILGFWPNHITNLWGNQVFFDLLHSVALFWFALMPRARAVRMPILPWFMYVFSTASLGGLHMYARILYLEQKQEEEGNAAAFGTSGTTGALYGANMINNEGTKEKVSHDRY